MLAAWICLLGVLLGATSVPAQTAPPADDDADFVKLPREDFEALMRRVANLEAIVGGYSDMRQSLDRLTVQIEGEENPNTLDVFYKDRLRLENDDMAFAIGGRINSVLTTASGDSGLEDGVGKLEDGMEMRRARIMLSGKMYGQFEYKAEYDFAGGDSDFKNVYMKLNDVGPVDHVRVGYYREPFSLEQQTSSQVGPFIERSLVSDLGPDYSTGVDTRQRTHDNRMLWAAGFFRSDADNYGNGSGDGDWAATARVTGLPIYDTGDTQRLLHLGASMSHRSAPDGMFRFRSRPEAHQLQRFADTGDFEADNANFYAAEIAYVHGPLTIQGEYVRTDVDTDTGSDPRLDGHYIQAAYYLTGESQPYNTKKGGFDRLTPDDPYVGRIGEGEHRGLGAWQVAARYSHIDLSDGTVDGGEMDNYTVGLNWYLKKNLRMMFNYVRSSLDATGPDGDADIFLFALQTDF